jgi:hypothetical protein
VGEASVLFLCSVAAATGPDLAMLALRMADLLVYQSSHITYSLPCYRGLPGRISRRAPCCALVHASRHVARLRRRR